MQVTVKSTGGNGKNQSEQYVLSVKKMEPHHERSSIYSDQPSLPSSSAVATFADSGEDFEPSSAFEF